MYTFRLRFYLFAVKKRRTIIMKMTKALVAAGLAVLLGAGTASAATGPNCGKVGLGYQGIFLGEPASLNGVSGRYWVNDNIGCELNVFYGNASVEADDVELGDGDILFGTAKIMYAPVVKTNSRFYIGLEGGWGSVNGSSLEDGDMNDITIWTLSPFMGAEYSFSDIPELGLNFEVGYRFHNVSLEDVEMEGPDADELDVNIGGTYVSLGAHYYF
jgi:hypothetical protein